jgi:hypothetical protein
MLTKGLLLVLIALKLAGFIDWPWFVVLLPAMYLFLCFIFASIFKGALKKKRPWAIKFGLWLRS